MKKIESFKIDHNKLTPGVYLSRVDGKDKDIYTYDIRFVQPNIETFIDIGAAHTIEHLGATFFRNSKYKDKIIYFGGMACLTGFYLVVQDMKENEVFKLIINMLKTIIKWEKEIPGTTKIECGNYLLHNLKTAQYWSNKVFNHLKQNKIKNIMKYPK